MACYGADEDIETGMINLTIPIRRPALKALMKLVFVTDAMREQAEFGDATMREVIETVEFLKSVVETDED